MLTWLLMMTPFFLIRLSKSIYKFGYRFIGQHIGLSAFKYKEWWVIGASLMLNDHTSSALDHRSYIRVSPGSSPLKRSSTRVLRRAGRVQTETRRKRPENQRRRESGCTAMESRETRRRWEDRINPDLTSKLRAMKRDDCVPPSFRCARHTYTQDVRIKTNRLRCP